MDINDRRRYFAEEICAVANIQTEALVDAFARVPREHFLGPGPWQIANPDAWQSGPQAACAGARGTYRTTPDADPKHLYHNVVVAIDASRNLNNGQPGSLASWLDALELGEGDRVAHIGCGVGYYTAIMAEVVGANGHVTGVEIDAELASRARLNLAHFANADAQQADGGEYDPGPVDAIFINAGVTHPRPIWLDSLRPGGRMIVPLTVAKDQSASGMGFMLKVKREGAGYTARFLSSVMIFPCIGSRSDELNQRLRQSMIGGNWWTAQSLRRDTHEPDETCWFHGEGFCLSTLP